MMHLLASLCESEPVALCVLCVCGALNSLICDVLFISGALVYVWSTCAWVRPVLMSCVFCIQGAHVHNLPQVCGITLYASVTADHC